MWRWFMVSNANHTLWDKIGFVMISETLRASAGELVCVFGALLGTLLEVLFFTPFKVNRPGNSE